jgi:hypothetical protein
MIIRLFVRLRLAGPSRCHSDATLLRAPHSLYASAEAMQSAWASARLADRETGVTEPGQALATHIGQGNKLEVPFFQGLLGEIEAEGDAAGALTRIDGALALADETGQPRATLSSIACAARFCSSAIRPTRRQPRRHSSPQSPSRNNRRRAVFSCAALDLAGLYNATRRPADAHALLAPLAINRAYSRFKSD